MANMPTRRRSGLFWIILVAIGVAASAYYLTFGAQQRTIDGIGGGDYALVDHWGNPFTPQTLVGHPSLLFFGYTHCPDVCPTTMAELSVLFDRMGEEANDIRVYFITVDPERDTPETLKDYLTWVSDRVLGVSGSREQVDKILAAWRIFAQKQPTSDGGYTVDHTASVFLVDRQGRMQGTIAYQEATEPALEKVRRLVSG